MIKKILVTIPITEEQKIFLEKQVESSDCEFIYKKNSELQISDVENVNFIFGSIPPKLLSSAKNLEWLQLAWAGADDYASEKILSPNVILTNAVGAYDTAVSEHLLALTFALIRNVEIYSKNMQKHFWNKIKTEATVENSTILILGAGSIGKSYAQKVKMLGAKKIIAVTRTAKEKISCFDEQFTVEKLDELLPQADILAMILPGGENTNHIMNYERLSKLKDGAYLINVGRGNAINPNDLKKILREGKLGGVALDVTEPEPLPENDELWDFENVLITPHSGGQLFLQATRDKVFKICAENLYNKFHNKSLKNIVNRKLGY